APVGLDAVTHSPRCVRRRHHPTAMTSRGQAAIDPKAAGPRLVHEHQLPPRRLELAYRSPQRIHVAADLTMMANLAAFLGNGEIDRFLVHIHTNVQLAPSKRRRCRPRSSQTPTVRNCRSGFLRYDSTSQPRHE